MINPERIAEIKARAEAKYPTKEELDKWEKLANAFAANTSISDDGEGRGMSDTIRLGLIPALRRSRKDSLDLCAEVERLQKLLIEYQDRHLADRDQIKHLESIDRMRLDQLCEKQAVIRKNLAEVERLRAENERLKEKGISLLQCDVKDRVAYIEMKAERDALQAENERAKRDAESTEFSYETRLQDIYIKYNDAQVEIDALRTENEDLRKILKESTDEKINKTWNAIIDNHALRAKLARIRKAAERPLIQAKMYDPKNPTGTVVVLLSDMRDLAAAIEEDETPGPESLNVELNMGGGTATVKITPRLRGDLMMWFFDGDYINIRARKNCVEYSDIRFEDDK